MIKVGDLVENTYVGALLRGKLGLVVGLEDGYVLVRYINAGVHGDARLPVYCLKVLS